MKKVVILSIVLFSFSFAKAQQVTLGGGLAYGTDIQKAGIILNGQYFFTDKVAAAPSFIFYFPDKSKYSGSGYSVEAKSSLWEFNADVNYYFFSTDVIKLFGEGGLNISTAKAKVKQTGSGFNQTNTSSETKAGLNLGIGVDFKAGDKIVPFFALKYTVSTFDQLVIKGGVRFLLPHGKK
jgi:outer membrane immunogenic protein